MNRKMAAILNERQKQLLPGGETAPGAQPHHSSGERLGQQHFATWPTARNGGREAKGDVRDAQRDRAHAAEGAQPPQINALCRCADCRHLSTLKGCSLSCVLNPSALSRTGLIFPTETTQPTGRTAERARRPCSAAPNPTSPGASSNLARRPVHASGRSPTRQAAWGAGSIPAAPTLSPRGDTRQQQPDSKPYALRGPPRARGRRATRAPPAPPPT